MSDGDDNNSESFVDHLQTHPAISLYFAAGGFIGGFVAAEVFAPQVSLQTKVVAGLGTSFMVSVLEYELQNTVENLFTPIANVLKPAVDVAKEIGTGLESAVEFVNEETGVHGLLPSDIAEGLEPKVSGVIDWISNEAEQVADGVSGAFESVKDWFTGDDDNSPPPDDYSNPIGLEQWIADHRGTADGATASRIQQEEKEKEEEEEIARYRRPPEQRGSYVLN